MSYVSALIAEQDTDREEVRRIIDKRLQTALDVDLADDIMFEVVDVCAQIVRYKMQRGENLVRAHLRNRIAGLVEANGYLRGKAHANAKRATTWENRYNALVKRGSR